MLRLLERRFRVNVRLEDAWTHLAKVEHWPSWARHIRRVEIRPVGPLNTDSEGVIYLTNGIRSTFRMTEFNVGENWKWVGPFLGVTVHYDHQFIRIGPEESELRFILDGDGFGVGIFGRLFAAIYGRNLDRAIPRLVAELQQSPPNKPPAAPRAERQLR